MSPTMGSYVYADYGDRGWEGVQFGIDGDVQIVRQTLTDSGEREVIWSLKEPGTERLRGLIGAAGDSDIVAAIGASFPNIDAILRFLADNQIELGDPWIHTDTF